MIRNSLNMFSSHWTPLKRTPKNNNKTRKISPHPYPLWEGLTQHVTALTWRFSNVSFFIPLGFLERCAISPEFLGVHAWSREVRIGPPYCPLAHYRPFCRTIAISPKTVRQCYKTGERATVRQNRRDVRKRARCPKSSISQEFHMA